MTERRGREVRGRYVARVEALAPNGEALARRITALEEPTPEELEGVFGPREGERAAPEMLAFVGGLPGEMVEVEVTWPLPPPGKKRAKRVPAPSVWLVAVREAAQERVTPRCNVFGVCGGCQLQHLAYPQQLSWKTERVRTALVAAGFDDPLVRPMLGCAPPWGYRNHMRFSVDREGRAGLTARGSRRVLPLQQCPIAHPLINTALEALARETLPRPQALVRCGEATGQMLLQPMPEEAVACQLREAGIDLRAGEMEEALRGVPFRIRPSSFFQTNTRQANQMAALVLERLPRGANITLVDAYCGVGTFALLLAPQAGRVIAIEESASAIRDAQWNLRAAPNIAIVQAKVEEALPRLTERLDGLVIDPPRAGCQRPVLDALAARRVSRVVYVSCDPDTLARDLAYLCSPDRGVYRLAEVQPLDMFPQTAHVENIATLEAL